MDTESQADESVYDATDQIRSIAAAFNPQARILLPREMQGTVDDLLRYILGIQTRQLPLRVASDDSSRATSLPDTGPQVTEVSNTSFDALRAVLSAQAGSVSEVRYNVKISRQKTLSKVIFHPPSAIVEYPETSKHELIGHMFSVSLDAEWINPTRNFAYSRGEPKGGGGSNLRCPLLVDDAGNEVPCYETHDTCQGSKVCPFSDLQTMKEAHTNGSRDAIAACLKERRISDFSQKAPEQQLLQKTLAFFTAVKSLGCSGSVSAIGHDIDMCGDDVDDIEWHMQAEKARRGHERKPGCPGRIIFQYSARGVPYIRCEYYSHSDNRDHFVNSDIGQGQLETPYLEALFLNNMATIFAYEENAAIKYGTGPRAVCSSVSNFSTNKVNCVTEHRNDDGQLVLAEMSHLPCLSTFKVYQPMVAYRASCPRVLVVCSGEHSHPIPLLSRPPLPIQNALVSVLDSIKNELSDMTPRRLLRHSALQHYLGSVLPSVPSPSLVDVHPSLANRDYLRNVIHKVRKQHFPRGTGWDGLLHMKSTQDALLPPDQIYIRRIIELNGLDEDPEDLDATDGKSFRLAICMFPEGSRQLLHAQYLQSDIAFKRVVGFEEFELGSLDPGSRTTLTFCRVFVNRQSAAAHQMIFDLIDEIVVEDTGMHLQWRHLHSPGPSDYVGILQFAVDQHRGQAKGLGLHLKRRAQEDPEKMDLHEPHRKVKDLDEYDHLRRILRLCVVHFYRNIRKTAVSEDLRNDMRSLVCIHHSRWDETLQRIKDSGKAGADWLADKLQSKFALPGVCWEKSLIPIDIWKVGDSTTNIIESVHADVNQEGVSCTLCGGVVKGRHFDTLKLKTLMNWNISGVRAGYKENHISVSAVRSLKRKNNAHHQRISQQDEEILIQNKRLQTAFNSVERAEHALQNAESTPGSSSQYAKAEAALERATEQYQKMVEKSRSVLGTGSGRVGVLLPESQGAALQLDKMDAL